MQAVESAKRFGMIKKKTNEQGLAPVLLLQATQHKDANIKVKTSTQAPLQVISEKYLLPSLFQVFCIVEAGGYG